MTFYRQVYFLPRIALMSVLLKGRYMSHTQTKFLKAGVEIDVALQSFFWKVMKKYTWKWNSKDNVSTEILPIWNLEDDKFWGNQTIFLAPQSITFWNVIHFIHPIKKDLVSLSKFLMWPPIYHEQSQPHSTLKMCSFGPRHWAPFLWAIWHQPIFMYVLWPWGIDLPTALISFEFHSHLLHNCIRNLVMHRWYFDKYYLMSKYLGLRMFVVFSIEIIKVVCWYISIYLIFDLAKDVFCKN